jgi:HlyD family secretion protein
LKAAEADISSVGKGGSQEEVLTNQANLTKARAEKDSAQRNLNALKKLQETGSASAGEVEEAQNRLQRAQAELNLSEQRKSGRYSTPEVAKVQAQAGEARAAYNAAQEAIKNTNITAPRAGTVYSLPIKAGQFVSAGDLLVEVAELDKLQVRAFVDEPEIGKLAPGQKVSLTWDAVPGRTWEGTVARIPTSVTMRGTRSVGEVVCAVSNKDLKLLPNVNVNVVIITDRRENVLSVSREAVMQAEGKRFVYAILDGRLHRMDVQTGVSSLTRIEVKNGLQQGTLVALGAVGSQPMAEGVEAKVVEKVN